MDENKDTAPPTTTNDRVINTLMEIFQQNALAIQNLVKDIAIIKIKISRDNDINGNK